ncbi:type IV secretory system conjugative DNA transfer family protein [Janibacter indicus]|uniref:Type IV secretory system conjugative DNA transfer family protein n=1 Tax=Janibacter indicus TaxID=857417 RepID=A0A7L9IZC9_9MICO|nr:TraM recognition domain-containing protein [Janibacter indicus]QOK22352.1 type IV secretory system conjugative DNA transfer family protein [Janibacter indicus]
MNVFTKIDPHEVGWHIGTSKWPRGAGDLWIRWERTTGVIGPQGSGKTLDALIPALLQAPGAALVTLTKPQDMLLSWTERAQRGPCVVADPFGLTKGLPEFVWDPIDGCVDPWIAERRAKAWTAGTIKGGAQSGQSDDAARFYANEAAKVLQCYLHAAALTGSDLDEVLEWVAQPLATSRPTDILRNHPHASPHWAGLLEGALRGDPRTAGNTITTVQQAMALFFQEDIRRRCVPGPGREATDIARIIEQGGTIYLLGREDPYASASPLMTAIAEHVLDTALALAAASPWGRLCPPILASLDELPSTAPLPTLQTRMANERALGISIQWAAQTRAQLTQCFGEDQARAMIGLTNNLVVFGGSKDVKFNQELSDLFGDVRIARHSWQSGERAGRNTQGDDIAVMTGAEIRELDEGTVLLIAENTKPIVAKVHRCITGRAGAQLLADQKDLSTALAHQRASTVSPQARAVAAIAAARRDGLTRQPTPPNEPAGSDSNPYQFDPYEV